MKLAYQISTPEVRVAPGVTAYQSDLETSFRRLKECGYEGAELMVANPRTVDVDLVAKLAAKYSLEIPMVCTGECFGQEGLCFSDPDDAKRNEAIRRGKEAVDLAVKFGAQINIGRFRGGHMFGFDDDLCLSRSNAGMKEVAAYAEKMGTKMAIEPVNPIASNYINTTQEGLALLKTLNEPGASIMLDSNHMFLSDKNSIDSIREAKGKFTYVHLVDSNRLWPGNCKIDFEKFIGTLKEVGYDGWLSVEVFQRPNQDYCLEASANHIIPILKKLGLRK